jgi:hypothetical protein
MKSLSFLLTLKRNVFERALESLNTPRKFDLTSATLAREEVHSSATFSNADQSMKSL